MNDALATTRRAARGVNLCIAADSFSAQCLYCPARRMGLRATTSKRGPDKDVLVRSYVKARSVSNKDLKLTDQA